MAYDTPTSPDTAVLSSARAMALGSIDLSVDVPASFRLQSGEALPQRRLLGRVTGRAGAPVVAVLGGISADRFPAADEHGIAGWWPGTVRPGGAIDLDRFRVIAIDFAPDSAATPAPITLTTDDQARLLALVLDAAEIDRLAGFIGCSYGGMVALAFAQRFPERLERLIVISAAHRAHPQATAWRGIQRRILQLAEAAGRPEDGIALARELAMTTYRTPEELATRFACTAPAAVGQTYPVCDYLTARGRDYRGRTTPARWLTLSDSADRHSVRPEAIRVPTTLVAFTSDRLVPVEDMRDLAARLPRLERLVEAPSLYGHDAFLKEDATVAAILEAALEGADA